ncbi:MAG: hypothetical protein ACP5UO_02470 [Thermoplasmata archaeon]
MKAREPAFRITSTELLGVDQSIVMDEGGTALGLTELGLPVSRFMISGKFKGKSEESDRVLIRVSDTFNEVTLNVGNFFSQSLEVFEEIQLEDPVAVIGKVSILKGQSQFSKRFYAESIHKISETEMRYFEGRAVLFLKERTDRIAKAISSGLKEKRELAALMDSERLGFGLSKRFELNGSVDLEKYISLPGLFLESLSRRNREVILAEIRNFREISLEELMKKLGDKINREDIEDEIRNLLNDGEIMEVKTGIYRYIP